MCHRSGWSVPFICGMGFRALDDYDQSSLSPCREGFVSMLMGWSSAYRTAPRHSHLTLPARQGVTGLGLIRTSFPQPTPRSVYPPMLPDSAEAPSRLCTPDLGSWAALANHHHLGSFKQDLFIIVSFWWSEIQTPSHWAEIKVLAGPFFLRRFQGENLLSCLFQLLEPSSLCSLTDGLSSTFKARSMQGRSLGAPVTFFHTLWSNPPLPPFPVRIHVVHLGSTWLFQENDPISGALTESHLQSLLS